MAMRKVAAQLGTERSDAARNIFIYLRVSTGRQAETDLSIPDQRRQIEAWAVAHGHAIVAEFLEPGASATLWIR